MNRHSSSASRTGSPAPLPPELLGAYPGPAILIDPEDAVHSWSTAAEAACGDPSASLDGRQPSELLEDAGDRAIGKALATARDSGAAELTGSFPTDSGDEPARTLRLTRVGGPDSGWVLLMAEEERGEASEPSKGHPEGLTPELMDALPYGVMVFQGQRLEYANPAAASLLDRSQPANLQGLMVASVVYDEDREQMGRLLNQAAETGRADGRLRLLGRQDQPLEMEASLALLGDPAKPTLQLVFHPLTRQRGLERALRESEERYRSLIGSLEEGFWMGGSDGATADVNQALLDLLGYARDEMLDRPLPDFADADERDSLRQRLNQLEESQPRTLQTRLMRRDGRSVPVSIRMVIMPDPSTGIPALFAFLTDLSAQQSLRKRLRRETGLNEAILSSLPGIFFLVGPALGLTRWNTNLSHQTGWAALDLAGLPAPELFVESDREAVRTLLEEASEGASGELEAQLVGTDGGAIPYELSVATGEHGFVAALGVDITERKALEADLERMATVDDLTGVWNRAAIDRELDREVERTRRYGNPLSLMLLDLDRFQQVNDQYGRETADKVLKDVAAQMGENKRATDLLARWGGNQFFLLAPDTEPAGARKMAENLRGLVAGTDFDPVASLQASFGVTSYQPGDTVPTLVERLERALRDAKNGGRNRVTVAGG